MHKPSFKYNNNNKLEYVKNIWHVIDWSKVEENYLKICSYGYY
ncbi:MAG TPA: hypothetical protein DG753_10350 [Clostridium sp.]|nr:hypothetical protein [Clostridium sp.]